MTVQKYDVRRPDGSFEEKHWSPLNTPVLNESGVQWIIHRVEDVTEIVRLKHEEAERDRFSQEQQRFIAQLRAANEELARSQEVLRESDFRFRGLIECLSNDQHVIDFGSPSTTASPGSLSRGAVFIAISRRLIQRVRHITP